MSVLLNYRKYQTYNWGFIKRMDGSSETENNCTFVILGFISQKNSKFDENYKTTNPAIHLKQKKG